MRLLFYPTLALLLIAYATNVSAGSIQGRVVYVQIGSSTRLKVDLDSQKAEPVLASTQAAPEAEVHAVNRADDAADYSLPTPLDGCWHLRASWKPLARSIDSKPVMANPDGFIIAGGTLIDVRNQLFLGGFCPSVITLAVTTKNAVLFSRKEVTGGFIRQGRILGLVYSDKEIIASSDARNASPVDIFRFKGRTRALSLDTATGKILLVREVTKTQLNPTGWLRAIAGHPKQNSTYDLVILDVLSSAKTVIRLAAEDSGQDVRIWF